MEEKSQCNMNATCENCEHVRNCLNGKYCTLADRYVEYLTVPVCETDGLFENQINKKNK